MSNVTLCVLLEFSVTEKEFCNCRNANEEDEVFRDLVFILRPH